MRFIQNLSQLFIFLFSIHFLVSCQLIPTKPAYLEFDEGIRQLSNGLLTELIKKVKPDLMVAVVNPFLDSDSGQVLQASFDIEALLINEAHKQFQFINISRLTSANLRNAQYIINGVIKYQGNNTTLAKKLYQVSASIVDLKTKTIVTNGTVWIASAQLNYQPMPSYEDNPMYIKGKRLKSITKTVESPIGTQVDADYYKLTEINAQLVTAQSAYDNGNYKLAHQLFKQLIQQPEGQMIETYGGLYAASFKLGNYREAERHFTKMILIGVENGNIPIKLLFKSNLTEFLKIPELQQQYALWLRQISLYFKNHSQHCVNIIGHTSRSGEDDYNKNLSKQRANIIQDQMRQIFQDIIYRSKTIGKGWTETIVGTVPDSFENAIDRRVEFKIVDCDGTDDFSSHVN